MSIYGDAISAIRSIILIEERLRSLNGKVDALANEVRIISDRLIRLETVIEIVRQDGAVLRIAAPDSSQADSLS